MPTRSPRAAELSPEVAERKVADREATEGRSSSRPQGSPRTGTWKSSTSTARPPRPGKSSPGCARAHSYRRTRTWPARTPTPGRPTSRQQSASGRAPAVFDAAAGRSPGPSRLPAGLRQPRSRVHDPGIELTVRYPSDVFGDLSTSLAMIARTAQHPDVNSVNGIVTGLENNHHKPNTNNRTKNKWPYFQLILMNPWWVYANTGNRQAGANTKVHFVHCTNGLLVPHYSFSAHPKL